MSPAIDTLVHIFESNLPLTVLTIRHVTMVLMGSQ